MAQPADDPSVAQGRQIEEIVVTARKREESLQETPISVSVFSTEDMRQRNMTNLMEVAEFAPNVVMSTAASGSGGGNNAQIYIRGVGQTDFLFTTDPGVGIYMDGVYLPRTLGGVLDLLDLERVEILRGPQGILFGKNTIGGAVNVISNKPTQEFGGYAELTAGSDDRFDQRLDLNLPITDTLASRIALSYKNRDGYSERVDFESGKTLDHQGSEDAFNGRASLRWTPSEDTTVDASFDYTHENQESAATTLVQFEPENGLAPLWNAIVGGPAGSPMTRDFISEDELKTFGTGPNKNKLEVKGGTITVSHDYQDMTLKSITAYREMDGEFGRDGDGSPNQYVHTDNDQTQEQFSQEFQLVGSAFNEKLDWLAGAFYMDEKGTDRNDVRLASGLYNALEGLPEQVSGTPCGEPWVAPGCAGNPINIGLDLDFDIYNKIKIESLAFYSHLDYQVAERWSLIGGLRYTDESKDYTLEHLRVNAGVPIIPLTTTDESWTEWTPTVGVDFQYDEQIMAYASVSRGFKSGGFNGRPTTDAEVEPFDPEYVTTYEIGIKTESGDRRFRLNAATFYMDYEDMQVGSVSADSTGNLVLVIDNVGEAEVMGFETDFVFLPGEDWMLSGGLGYIDAEYKKVGSATEITVDSDFVKTPKWTASASVEYSYPLDSYGDLTLRGDWSYQSKVYNDPQNTQSIAQSSYDLVSARITLHNAAYDFDVIVSGTNLTDETYLLNGLQALESFGHAEGVYGPGREWAVTLSKNF